MSDEIAKANPASLDELFSRDPMGYSDEDIATIVAIYRAQREVPPEGKPTKAKPTKEPKPKRPSLADLGLV